MSISRGPTIFINGRFLTRQGTGVDRYAFEIVHELGKLSPPSDGLGNPAQIILVVPSWYRGRDRFGSISCVKAGRLRGQLWEQLWLPTVVGSALLVNLCNTAPVCKKNQLVAIHDAAIVRFPKSFSLIFRLWYRFLLPLVGARVARVITPSHFAADELVACFGISRDRISVVPNAVDHVAREDGSPGVLRRYGLGKGRYVLAVGSNVAYKNFDLLKLLSTRLEARGIATVVTGGGKSSVFGRTVGARSGCVRYLGYVSDRELVELYTSAACFVFPSRYEGFGIPPLEAMACGCAVVSSSAPAMREVLADAAAYFDPNDAEALFATVERVLDDGHYRAELIRCGRRRVTEFSWRQSARQVRQLCEAILCGSK